MQMKPITWRQVASAVVVTGICVIAWILPPLHGWLRAFIKLEEMQVPYLLIYFSTLLFLLLFSERRIRVFNAIKAMVLGAVAGQIVGTLSILAAGLWVSDALSRFSNTISANGIFALIGVNFMVALILGSWLTGAIALVMHHYFERRCFG